MSIVDNDCISHSDAIILLEGDGYHRVPKVIELYNNGFAELIIFSGNIVDKSYGSYPFDEIKPLLLQGGIKESDIMHENKSLNTREQAIEIVNMAKKFGWKKLILVASHEHQVRAYLTFLRVVIDFQCNIIFYNAPARNLNWFKDSGWGTRLDRLKAEIDRIERYCKLGHLASFAEVIEYQKWKESLL